MTHRYRDDWVDEEEIAIRHGGGYDDRRWDNGLSAGHVDRVSIRHRSRSRDARPPPVVIDRHDHQVVDALEDIRDELHAHGRGRSREPQWRDPSPNPATQAALIDMRERLAYDRREKERLEREIERLRREDRPDRELIRELEVNRMEIQKLEERVRNDERSGRFKGDMELARLRDDARRDAEERRREKDHDAWLAERERAERKRKEEEDMLRLRMDKKQRQDEDERKEIADRIRIQDAKKKQAEEDAEKAAVEAYRRRQEEEKKKRDDLRKQFELEEAEKKEKAKKEKQEWIDRIEKDKREEEEKKKKKEEEFEEEMRKRLHRFGFQDNQVDVLVDPKAKDKLPKKIHRGDLPSNALVVSRTGPTFIKIHKNHIDIETLKYYNISWEYDPVSHPRKHHR
jgi:hypothetical protein